jgi:transposase
MTISENTLSNAVAAVFILQLTPQLNPIGQFWSVCKSKLKRKELLQEEALSSRS